jgi:hypothetical protein
MHCTRRLGDARLADEVHFISGINIRLAYSYYVPALDAVHMWPGHGSTQSVAAAYA